MTKKDAWVIIPAHNEQRHITSVIRDTKKYLKNIIVVDDGSTDNTYELALKEKVYCLRHVVNLGKGSSLKTGIRFAMKKKAEKIVLMDGDGQHTPNKIPEFLEKLNTNDIVFGYRRLKGDMPQILRFGNSLLSTITKILFRIKLKDTQSGYRAFRTKIYRKIRWSASGYSMESEMIANVGKHKLKYAEIPIKTVYSDKYKGTTILHGVEIVIDMLYWKLTK